MESQIKYFMEMHYYHNIEVPAKTDKEAIQMFTDLVLALNTGSKEELVTPKRLIKIVTEEVAITEGEPGNIKVIPSETIR